MEAVTTKKWSWDNFVKRKKYYTLFWILNGAIANVSQIYFS